MTIGLMAVLYNLLFSLTVTFFSHIPPLWFHANIITLSTSTSYPPVACFADPKYLHELVRGIRFPAKHVGLKPTAFFSLDVTFK